ncbi:hypothetical protein [Aeromicrobium sp. CTD01-1L150]|uniref:hypothetical protein n=1 Tax=Aeromicrobium sp. CTD01-1L150 TaxID=3341830 RepID=UPI0035C0F3BD
MPEDVDPLLTGRAGLSYAELDAAAHRLHDLLTHVAERQIDRPLLHEFDIDVATDASHTLTPPAGYRRPAAGAITTTLDVTSRSVPAASTHVRVTVWPALGGADVVDLLVERRDELRRGRRATGGNEPEQGRRATGDEYTLEVRLDEIHPEVTEGLRGRVNDFVARQVALVVSGLNVTMQRHIGRPD